MNNKIVSVVLVAGIAVTGFAGISAANDTTTGFFKGNPEIRELMEKIRSGEELTIAEQATLDEMKKNRGERGTKFGGKRMGGGKLSDEEKSTLESMSDNEKKIFFEAKKGEMKAQKETHKAVVDALIAGHTFTADQEATRLEMIAKMENPDSNYRGNGEGREIIAKILENILSIVDTGKGISSKDQEKIFERFYQGSTSRNSEGFGIGLSLVKKIADANNWKIELESELGKESTFRVMF